MKLFRPRNKSTAAGTTVQDGAAGDASSGFDLANALDEMSFLDHLEELRWRILKGIGGVLLGSILCAIFDEFVIDQILLGPTKQNFFMYQLFGFEARELVLQNRTVTGQFFAYWGSVLVVGIIIGAPITIYQFWKFIEPGLYPEEKRGMRFSALFATGFFVLGVSFGYCVITPMALQFFANFVISEQIVNEFDITKYFSLVTTWVFGVGLLFELPVVMFFLAKTGIVNAGMLRKGRKYALIAILVLGAFLTPPDPVSQLLVAVPMVGLYELSIWITQRVERREKRRQQALE